MNGSVLPDRQAAAVGEKTGNSFSRRANSLIRRDLIKQGFSVGAEAASKAPVSAPASSAEAVGLCFGSVARCLPERQTWGFRLYVGHLSVLDRKQRNTGIS
jgi:hypothetical protein